MQPIAISADTPEQVTKLCQNAGLTFPILSDHGLDAIHQYDLSIAERGVDGSQAGGPGEFLIDASDTVRWRKLTEIHPNEITSLGKVL